MLLTAILAFAHVLSAMAWLGGGILFGFFVAPKLGHLPPSSSRDFFLSVVPGIARFFQAAAGATIVFGLLLLYNMTHGDLGMLGFSTAWGFDITVGMVVALLAFVVSEALAAPALVKVVRLMRSMGPNSGPPPAELPKAIRLAGSTATLTLVLLLITLGLMVSAGFY